MLGLNKYSNTTYSRVRSTRQKPCNTVPLHLILLNILGRASSKTQSTYKNVTLLLVTIEIFLNKLLHNSLLDVLLLDAQTFIYT
jgi:hypothetical protein